MRKQVVSEPFSSGHHSWGRGVMKLAKQILNSWKVGKCIELKLFCEVGVMKVTITADLGAWVQSKPKEASDRGYQGSRRRASPSYLQR